jgi:diguanylate cyclase (GGDEF)-like protein
MGRTSRTRRAPGETQLKTRLRRLAKLAAVDPVERRLAGLVNGLLYTLGGVTLAAILLLPGVSHTQPLAVLVIAGIACIWGICQMTLINWDATPQWVSHASTCAGFVVIALAVAFSGGASSPTWIYLFFVAVFASYFYRRPIAFIYLGACVAVQALPYLYDSNVIDGTFSAQLVIAGPTYLVLGGGIVAGKTLMWKLRARAERLAAEHGSLRRVAVAVVRDESPEQIYGLMALEAAALVGGGGAGILRLEGEDQATVLGAWAEHEDGRYTPGTVVPIRPGSDVERALQTQRSVRAEHLEPDTVVAQLGYGSSVFAPIQVAERTWGILAVAAEEPASLTSDHEERLMEFGDLLATAIASIENRARLTAQAASDPLTGLANHRTLQEQLTSEVARAGRHGLPLSVAVIDIDHFKQINDSRGHDAGDETLVGVAQCLESLARTEDTLARVGGDEFAWILPEANSDQALVAVERARRMITQTLPESYRVTVSAGICDTSVSPDPAQLIRLADGALYWSKAHGRNQCWIYDPAVVAELSVQERAERLERSQALLGLRALARAIDAKDPATRQHSERVATVVGKLARAAGWSPEQAMLLSEAALVHDVGKIGVPDAVLRKTEPLTSEDWALITDHAELSARIVDGVLMPQQVEWIRTHHERPDGDGYPDGLTEEEIPEGAALLAVADAWDVMTISRPYSTPKTNEEALRECLGRIGTQFTPAAVEALATLHAAGELQPEEPIREPVVTPFG